MKTFISTVFLGIALFLMGCPTRSLYPLFADKDITFNPNLVGAWNEIDNHSTYVFKKGEGKDYEITIAGKKGDTTHYKLQLGRLGKYWFFDSFPKEDPVDFHMIPTHLISKIWLQGDTLKFSFLESDSLIKRMGSGKLKIAATYPDDNMILTSSTEELQKVILEIADDDAFFPKSDVLIRMK